LTKLKSIAQQWQSYYESILKPLNASKVQIDETRQAFYAGAWAMYAGVEAIGNVDISEERGHAYLEACKRECQDFKNELMAKYVEKN
jgi:hypothetical protein